jgi:hypothetical protein
MTNESESESSVPQNYATELTRPLGEALGKAVDKLTSQIFLFLIAYLILVIFLTMRASDLSVQVRVLLDLIPALGVIAYVYLEKKKIAEVKKKLQIDVNARIATGGASVTGLRGPAPDSLNELGVTVGYAGGKAQVIGVDSTPAASSGAADREYLLQLFETLDAKDRLELIGAATRMHMQQTPNPK